MKIEKEKIGTIAILLISFCGVCAVFMQNPLAQDIGYHLFVDDRTLFNIPNFWNVISNFPFIIVGGMGLYSVCRSGDSQRIDEMGAGYFLFFIGITQN